VVRFRCASASNSIFFSFEELAFVFFECECNLGGWFFEEEEFVFFPMKKPINRPPSKTVIIFFSIMSFTPMKI